MLLVVLLAPALLDVTHTQAQLGPPDFDLPVPYTSATDCLGGNRSPGFLCVGEVKVVSPPPAG